MKGARLTDVLPLPRVMGRTLPVEVAAENTDEQLMVRYGEGDFAAMEALVARYHPRLHSFFVRTLAPPELIDDLVQDTFIRLMEQAVRYQPTGRFSTYLFTIASNLLKDERKRSRQRDLSLDDFPSDTYRFDRLSADAGEIGNAVEQTAGARRVRFALSRLSHDLRVAVVLHHYHAFTYEEIAGVVGCPAGTAKSRVHHAVRQLRAMLGVDGDD